MGKDGVGGKNGGQGPLDWLNEAVANVTSAGMQGRGGGNYQALSTQDEDEDTRGVPLNTKFNSPRYAWRPDEDSDEMKEMHGL